MEYIAQVLIGKPLNILIVSVLLFVGFLAVRNRAKRPPRLSDALLLAAILWAVYAAWEWLILLYTPEANIRVDLLLIWPVLTASLLWVAFRCFR